MNRRTPYRTPRERPEPHRQRPPDQYFGLADTPWEFIAVLIASAGVLGVLASVVLGWIRSIPAWLMDLRLLLPADVNPLLELPGMGGAGLDIPQIQIGVGLGLIVGAMGVDRLARAVHHHHRERDLA